MIDVDSLSADLMEQAEVALQETGEALKERVAAELTEAAQDLARLTVTRARGESIAEELPHVRAKVANWSWVGADLVRRRWLDYLRGTAHVVGEVAGGVLEAAL